MKALCIDGATSRMTIAAKNDDKIFTSIYDIGMKQSESIVPAIEEVLQKVELDPEALDYSAMSIGPGSFTGLRLAISALKAFELASDSPVYGISTLEMYAFPFMKFNLPVLSAIDANKGRFYARIVNGEKMILQDGDWETETIIQSVRKIKSIILAGPDCEKLEKIIKNQNKKINIYYSAVQPVTTDSLFALAEKKITARIPPLKDFDGPVYLRASEAEIKLNATSSKA